MASLLTAPAGAAVAGFVAEAYGLPAVVYGAAGVLALTALGAWLGRCAPPADRTAPGPPGGCSEGPPLSRKR